MTYGSLKGGELLLGVLDVEYGPKCPFGDHGLADHVGHGQDVLLDLRGEAEHAHDLRESGEKKRLFETRPRFPMTYFC